MDGRTDPRGLWDLGARRRRISSRSFPRGWQNLYHNAVAILHEVSDYELRVRLQDPYFAARVGQVLRLFETYMNDQDTGRMNTRRH